MEDLIGRCMMFIAGILYLILFLSLEKWGARKVDDTMTIYLWKLINLVRRIKA